METVQNFKSEFDFDLLIPKSIEALPGHGQNMCKDMSKEKGVIVQKPFFHRRTDRHTERRADRPPRFTRISPTTSLARVEHN